MTAAPRADARSPLNLELLRGAILLAALQLAAVPLAHLFAAGQVRAAFALGGLLVVGTGIIARFLPGVRRAASIVQLIMLLIGAGCALLIAAPGALSPAPSRWWGDLREVVQLAGVELAVNLPPVTVGPGTLVLGALLAGLFTLLADIPFMELRRPIPAVLVLLTVALTASVHAGVPSWWTAAAPVLGALLLLAAPVPAAAPAASHPRPAASGPPPAARRPGRAAPAAASPGSGQGSRPSRGLAAALVLSLLVITMGPVLGRHASFGQRPTHPVTLTQLQEFGGHGNRGLQGMILSDTISVRRSLTQGETVRVLTYTPRDGIPSDYLKLRTLTRFDGDTFSARIHPPISPARSFSTPSDAFTTIEEAHAADANDQLISITIENLTSDRVPVPSQVRSLAGSPDFELPGPYSPLGEVSTGGRALRLSGQVYTVGVDPSRPTGAELAQVQDVEVKNGDRRSPLEIEQRPEIVDLAAQVKQDAGAVGPYATARAYEDFFHREFTYSLTAQTPAGEDPLSSFLADRVGYCEQYAAVFALMMNAQGYPTRVVIGYTGGSPNGQGGYTVTNRNAHAWPEVWFGPEYGWVRFEPTPPDAAPDVAPPPETSVSAPAPTDQGSTDQGNTGQGRADQATTEPTDTATQGGASPSTGPSGGAPEKPVATTPPAEPSSTPEPATDAPVPAHRRGSTAGALWGVLGVILVTAAGAAVLLWLRRRRGRQREERWATAAASADAPAALARLAVAEIASAVEREPSLQWRREQAPDDALIDLAAQLERVGTENSQRTVRAQSGAAACRILAPAVMSGLYAPHTDSTTAPMLRPQVDAVIEAVRAVSRARQSRSESSIS